MTDLQTQLQRACQALQLDIAIPFTLAVDDDTIHALALLPELGAPGGMLVVQSYDELKGLANRIVEIGYGYSVLDSPAYSEPYDLHLYTEMFTDWGWARADKPQPSWMN